MVLVFALVPSTVLILVILVLAWRRAGKVGRLSCGELLGSAQYDFSKGFSATITAPIAPSLVEIGVDPGEARFIAFLLAKSRSAERMPLGRAHHCGSIFASLMILPYLSMSDRRSPAICSGPL